MCAEGVLGGLENKMQMSVGLDSPPKEIEVVILFLLSFIRSSEPDWYAIEVNLLQLPCVNNTAVYITITYLAPPQHS
jgi:hypothetical protein